MSLLRGHDERALRKWPTLLLSADPGPDRLLAAVRLYNPKARAKTDEIIVYGHIVLHGPVAVTPDLTRHAGLPDGMAAAYYAGVMDQKDATQRNESGKLVRGLAVRLGGTVHPADLVSNLRLLLSVYAENDLPAEQIVSLLRPWAAGLAVRDPNDNGYVLACHGAAFFVSYFAPDLFGTVDEPRALGEPGQRKLHHWDLIGYGTAVEAPAETVERIGEAALALARAVSGVAIDMHGFQFSRAQELAGH
jgi:hypothetical protein